MTCIAWDGKTLAADKRGSEDGMISVVTKIWRVDDMLVGGAGSAALIAEVLAWIRLGRDPATFPAAQRDKDDWQPVLVIESDATLSYYVRSPFPVRIESQSYAVGSGREVARTAMFLGKTARESVAVACALDHNCGNGIDTLEL